MEALYAARTDADWSAAEQHARRLVELLPADDYAKQLLALAAYKSRQPDALSALARAKDVLLALHPHDTRDPETLGLEAESPESWMIETVKMPLEKLRRLLTRSRIPRA